MFPKRLRPRIGRKTYKLLRDKGNPIKWVDGEPTKVEMEEVVFRANIQPTFDSYSVKTMLSGYREREVIAIYSLDYIFTAKSNDPEPRQPDVILYNNAMWLVIWQKPYQNLGYHSEAYAVKMIESERNRIDGEVFGRK